ncbi:hypothetical protein [Pseudomonas weihenstephanensis]|uniref:hypothetical protein n=1 Tax=Pseudomonas weihenstephanensis TaxID=1608994 RepID=UPI00193C23F8|nr:hypothetical protein [Pseudomonas weihenstephanensis]MBM1189373.1 hypothetical protein [Pseudomonas weihenstephanensis]
MSDSITYSVVAFRLDHRTFCIESRVGGTVARKAIDQFALMHLKCLSGSSAQRLEVLRKQEEDAIGETLRRLVNDRLKSLKETN